MTEIILKFPVRRAAPLFCVCFQTGNPARPLVCKWVADEEAGSGAGSAPHALTRRICA